MPLLKPGQSAFSQNPAPQLQALQSAVKPPAPVLPKPTYSAAPQQSYQAPQNMQPPQNYSNDFNTAGSIGSKDVVAPPAPPSATSNSDALMKAYLDSMKPSDYQQTLQDQASDLQNQYNKSNQNQQFGNSLIEDQAIPLNFQTGREANLAKQYELQRQGIQNNQLTVQQKLANEQAKRQSAIDVTKTMVELGQKQQELNKPVFGSYGASGYQLNPQTGQYEPIASSGSAFNDPLISAAIQNGQLTPDMITRYGAPSIVKTLQSDPTFNFVTGKASASGQIAAGTSGATYKLNPLTGQYEQPNASAAHNPPGASAPAPSPSASAGGTGAPATTGSGPNTLPAPTTYAQKDFANSFSSGPLSKQINAQNTAVGHLIAAYQLGQQMHNLDLKGGNTLKNWLGSQEGQAAINNYSQAHVLSANELSAAYGADTGAERTLNASIGDANSSPAQILGNVQTSTALLASKILANVQQYKTTYGQNAPINLNWFVSAPSQQALSSIGVVFKTTPNDVAAYQVQPDGTAKKIY